MENTLLSQDATTSTLSEPSISDQSEPLISVVDSKAAICGFTVGFTAIIAFFCVRHMI